MPTLQHSTALQHSTTTQHHNLAPGTTTWHYSTALHEHSTATQHYNMTTQHYNIATQLLYTALQYSTALHHSMWCFYTAQTPFYSGHASALLTYLLSKAIGSANPIFSLSMCILLNISYVYCHLNKWHSIFAIQFFDCLSLFNKPRYLYLLCSTRFADRL